MCLVAQLVAEQINDSQVLILFVVVVTAARELADDRRRHDAGLTNWLAAVFKYSCTCTSARRNADG